MGQKYPGSCSWRSVWDRVVPFFAFSGRSGGRCQPSASCTFLFFWSWANYRIPGFTGAGADAASMIWGIVDALLPLLCGAMGVALIRARGA